MRSAREEHSQQMRCFRGSTNRPLDSSRQQRCLCFPSSLIWGKIWSWYSLKGVCIIEKTLSQLGNAEQSGRFTDFADEGKTFKVRSGWAAWVGGVWEVDISLPSVEEFIYLRVIKRLVHGFSSKPTRFKLVFFFSTFTSSLDQTKKKKWWPISETSVIIHCVLQLAGVFLCSRLSRWFITLLIKALSTKFERKQTNSRGLCFRKTSWITLTQSPPTSPSPLGWLIKRLAVTLWTHWRATVSQVSQVVISCDLYVCVWQDLSNTVKS